MSQTEEKKKEIKAQVNKWDGATVKFTIDDTIRNIIEEDFAWKEKHSLLDIRLFISFISVVFAGSGLLYDYKFPYPASAHVCAFCSIAYFITIGILQLYMTYVEKSVFYQGIEKEGKITRSWRFSGDLNRYDDKYTLHVSFKQGNSSGSAEITKSISNFITENGDVVVPALKKEVKQLYEKCTKKD